MATISSLSAGSSIALTEASGTGYYTLVHHNYNSGKAMLLRNSSIGNSTWRSSVPAANSNIFQGSTLDNYLINWYETLPSSTKQYLTTLNYPVTDSNYNGNKIYITRTACTISAAETSFADHANWQDIGDLDYLGSLGSGATWWTRQPSSGTTYAYSVTSDGTECSTIYDTYSRGVRPTVGVLETQEVVYDSSMGAYTLTNGSGGSSSSRLAAPSTLYLDGGEYNFGMAVPGREYELSWDAVSGAYGYSIYYSTEENGTYTWIKDVVTTSATVNAANTYSTYRYFKVQTLSQSGDEDSPLSTAYRSVSTRASDEDMCTGPTAIYLNGSSTPLTNVVPGTTMTLSWTPSPGSVSSYGVYYSDTGTYPYTYIGSTTGLSMEVSAPSTYSTTRTYSISTWGTVLGSDSFHTISIAATTAAQGSGGGNTGGDPTDPGDSSVTTPTGFAYYNGNSWIIPKIYYYTGSVWVSPTFQYYSNSNWNPVPPAPDYSWEVVDISGASYGFNLLSDGYYESTNQGMDYSYSICKVNIVADGTSAMYVDCINYAESNFDYGLLSELDTTLGLNYNADSTGVKQSFKGMSTANVQTIYYGVPSKGSHYIYVKFIKDQSTSNNNDSLRFRVRFSSGTEASSYSVVSVTGASYGFILNNNGYYESTNQGIDSSYAMCRVNISSNGTDNVYFDCINFGENNWDYGLLSEVNCVLAHSNEADSSNVHHSFKSTSQSSVQTVNYGVLPAGNHYVYVKYLKDGSQSSNNDTLQFKVRFA